MQIQYGKMLRKSIQKIEKINKINILDP